ncbi:MAG: aspartate/glutamate racemase family protein, partial [Chloroflexi bacterium]|nr:aspartate/glutamate racemase family protein [Chloroflexota bacterium]
MKTIGLIGGMSWESSLEYYRLINEGVKARLGGLHSAKSVLVSVDFAEIEALQHTGRWAEAAQILIDAARGLERAGADCVLICTNTMHKVADDVQASVRVPLIHIADATAGQVKAAGLTCIGLLGTRFTMEEEFYVGRLVHQYGLDVIVPEPIERDEVHRVIYDELCLGITRAESKARYVEIIAQLIARGAQGIILGCTE